MNAALFAVVASLVVLTAFAPPGGHQDKTTPAVRHLGFAFERGQCELGLLNCVQRQPLDWTAGEIDDVKAGLDEIAARALGGGTLDRCQQRGFTVFRRYRFPAGRGPADGRAAWSPDAALYRDRFVTTIDIFDAFFKKREQRDQFSGTPGYLLLAQVLLHECFHALDDVSSSDEFLAVVGFVRTGSKPRFAAETASEVAALVEYEAELKRIKGVGSAEHWRVVRSFALQMRPARVPSMQSLQSPAEAFADIGSHLVLDPGARRYLPARVVTYFDTRVFSVETSRDRPR